MKTGLPRPAHIVVVMMENHSYSDIVGNGSAPYINSLASSGALFTRSFAVTHPSQPNYLALFSGSTQGVSGDACPNSIDASNLGSQLLSSGRTFTGYSEDLPQAGFTGCSSGSYARKHVPWVNFSSLPASTNQPLSAFPSSYGALPNVSFVIPNLDNDMHDGTVAQGDGWLRQNLSGYAQWARNNNSLLIVTWDEDDDSQNNQIPTIFYGAQVKAGSYSDPLTHYRVLHTIESLEGLPALGAAADTQPITDTWTR
jgi:hypothetical protein